MYYSTYRTETQDYAIIDDEGYAILFEGEIVTAKNFRDIVEMVATLNDGADVSVFFASDNDEYYGCPEHAMFGDAWLYRDSPEAFM